VRGRGRARAFFSKFFCRAVKMRTVASAMLSALNSSCRVAW